MAKNELTVIDSAKAEAVLVPSSDEISSLMEELSDLDRIPYGRIKIPSGGGKSFQVFNPGEDDSDDEKVIEGVIIMSHNTNGYWPDAYDGTKNPPVCQSGDGETGIWATTGEVRTCKDCPYNQFGSGVDNKGNPSQGKACKNMRQVYILRRGDIFPMVLTLPPTALGAFAGYRVKVTMSLRKKMNAIMTRITLKTAQSATGVAYSTPVFEAVGALDKTDAAAVAAYAAEFIKSAVRVSAADVQPEQPVQEFVEVSDADVPFDVPSAAPDETFAPIE